MAVTKCVLVFVSLCLITYINGNEDHVSTVNNDQELQELTLFILNRLTGNEENSNSVSVRILDAQKQAGDGIDKFFMYIDMSSPTDEKICHVIVTEDPLSKERNLLEDRIECAEKEGENKLPGHGQGFSELHLDSEIHSLANLAVRQLEEQDKLTRTVLRILSAKKEVNSDNYYLTLKVTKSQEDGGDASELEVCELQLSKSPEVVLESSSSCFPVDSEESLLPEASDINEAAEEAASHLSSLTSSQFVKKLQDVMNADRSVTTGSGGSLTSLQLRLASTFCLKSMQKPSTTIHCPVNESQNRIVCSIISWRRQWMNDTLYSEPSCTVEDGPSEISRVLEVHRTPVNEPLFEARRLSCPGCLEDVDVNNLHVKQLANLGVAHYDDNSNEVFAHAVVRIKKAQRQVVAGYKYILLLDIAETNCAKMSHMQEVDRAQCELKSDASEVTCEIEFIQPAVGNTLELISNNCTLPDQQHVVYDQFSWDREANTPSREGRVNDGTVNLDEIESMIVPHNMENSEESDEFSQVHDVSLRDAANTGGNEATDSVQESNTARPIHHMVGGLADTDESEEESIREMATFALKTLDEYDEDTLKRVLLQIISSKKQVVAGILYHLTIRVGLSSCTEEEEVTDACIDKVEPTKHICKLKILYQPWMHIQRKLVNSECNPETDFEGVEQSQVRNRRSASGMRDNVFGGKEPADVNDPYIQELADFALFELDKKTNSLYRLGLVRIIKATKQTVAGLSVELDLEVGLTKCRKSGPMHESCAVDKNSMHMICRVKIWDQPWLKKRQVTDESCARVKQQIFKRNKRADTQQSQVRNRRSASGSEHLVGGKTPADVNDPYIQELADFALFELDKKMNSIFELGLVQILTATKQVVSGVSVELELEVGYSKCRKSSGMHHSCAVDENSAHMICQVKIWDQPWLKKRQLTYDSCSPKESLSKRNKRADEQQSQVQNQKRSASESGRYLAGGKNPADVNEGYIQELANFALFELDKKINSLFRLGLVQVHKATKQVVSGLSVELELEVGYSKCRKNGDHKDQSCAVDENSEHMICRVKIWDQPWLKKRQVTDDSCSPVKSLSKTNKRTDKQPIGSMASFKEFMKKHKKRYSNSMELKHRYKVFKMNMKKVQFLQRTEQGTATYGATRFADLTVKEFKKHLLGLRPDLRQPNSNMRNASIPNITIPPSYDWRHYNAVTPVKDQGFCGSCWAFSVTGNVEGQWALHRGKLVSLSEQELVDCDKLDDGCGGGLPSNAYEAIMNLGGLEGESDYPYEGFDEKCHFNKSEVRVTIQGAMNISKNETEMAQWLVKNGPISIGINANAMQFYLGGVSHPWKVLCNPDNLDHGVLIVGYGIHRTSILHRTLPYWLIKNSWGESWGEQGYYRVFRGDGTCGVNQMASSATVE